MLEDRIRMWREAMRQREALGADDIEELESHLREEVARLAAAGLSEGEAFIIAARRLGHGDELAAEFGKVNGAGIWTRRLQWMLLGYLMIPLIWSLVGALVSLCTLIPVLWRAEHVGSTAFAFHAGGNALVFLMFVAAALALASGRCTELWQAAHSVAAVARSKSGTALAIGAVLLLSVVGRALDLASPLLAAKLMPIDQLGIYHRDALIFSFATAIAFPVVILALILWIDRQRARPANAA